MQLTWKSKFRDRLKFLRCPPKSLSNDDAPAFKRPRVTNDVEISETEMEEYECNVRSLQKEMEKKPKVVNCAPSWRKHPIRKKWIHEAQPPIGDILTKFPAFRKPKVVSLIQCVCN